MSETPVRVLFHPFFFLAETWNGMDEHMRLLAKHLDSSRFELFVMEQAGDGPQTRLLAERAGIGLIAAPYDARAGFVTRVRSLRNLYQREKIGALHMHSPAAGGQTAPALAARWAGVPATIATYHQIQPWPFGRRARVVNQMTHRLLIDTTIAVSRDVGSSLVKQTGIPAGKVRVVHNGIDMTDIAPENPGARSPDVVQLAYFGRLSEEKGVADLLHALAGVAPRCPAARTWIVGDGPQRGELEGLALRLGISDRVEFLGFRDDARDLMARSDIIVHVPRYEGFGIVLLEAMAAGKPVVTNDAPGGMAEIVVEGGTGLIATAGSQEALVEAIVRLVDDAEARERLGRNARERCEQKFSARAMALRTAEVYEAAFNRRRRSTAPSSVAKLNAD